MTQPVFPVHLWPKREEQPIIGMFSSDEDSKSSLGDTFSRTGSARSSLSSLSNTSDQSKLSLPGSNRASRVTLPLYGSSKGTFQPRTDRRLSAIGKHHLFLLARSSKLSWLLICLLCLLLVIHYNPATTSLLPALYLSTFFRETPQQFGDLILRPQDHKERVTLITVFGGSKGATYLPLLFQTAVQNAGALDLLFVNVDQGEGCLDLSYVTDIRSPTYGRNIKHLCLPEVENDEYYTRFICNGWKEGCDTKAHQTVMTHLEDLRNQTRAINDEIFNTFKPCQWLPYHLPITGF